MIFDLPRSVSRSPLTQHSSVVGRPLELSDESGVGCPERGSAGVEKLEGRRRGRGRGTEGSMEGRGRTRGGETVQIGFGHSTGEEKTGTFQMISSHLPLQLRRCSLLDFRGVVYV